MLRLSIVPLLALLAPLVPAQAPPAGPEEARIEVQQGRAVVVHGGAPERTLRRNEQLSTTGETHLEVGAGAQVRVLWLGRGSLQAWGPASLRWGPADPKTASGPEDLSIEIYELAWADFETRRGAHELRLPGAWRVRMEAGAIHLRGLPAGPVELRHHAGRPLQVDWLGDASNVRPPIVVYPGSNVRLERPGEPPATGKKRNVRAWDQVEWPWRRAVDSPLDAAERERLSALLERRARGLEPRPVPPSDTVGAPSAEADATPFRVTFERSADGARTATRETGSAASTPETPAVSEPADETPPPSPERALHPAAAWRGIAREALTLAGPLAVQRGPGVEVGQLPSGRWKVLVDAVAGEPSWVFGPDADYQLQPGAVALFEVDGRLGIRSGTVRGEARQRGRPDAATLAR